MIQVAEKKIVPAHSIIFRQGDAEDCCFIILSGKARVFRKEISGQETDLGLLGTGDGFGERALLTAETQPASVEALEETQLLVIGKKKSVRGSKNEPGVLHASATQMSSGIPHNASATDSEKEHQFKAPRFSWLDCLFIVVISILCGLIFNLTAPNGLKIIPEFWSDETIPSVAPQTALTRHWGNSLFVDARPNFFYKQEHIKNAINMPSAIFDIMYMMELTQLDKNKSIIVYGRTVSRLYDEQVAMKLVLRGHNNTMILEGGLSAWKKKGYPIS